MAIGYQTVRVIEFQYGVHAEDLDALETLASDETLTRTVEKKVEMLLRLERRLRWRIDRYGGMVFSPRELEAMRLDVQANGPTRFGPAVARNATEYVAAKMGVSTRHVNRLLASADMMMFWLSHANAEYCGWVDANAGRRDRKGNALEPKWELQAPTAGQTAKVLEMVDWAVRTLKVA